MGIKLLRYLPSVIWMSIIFYLSHQPASESAKASRGILTFILENIPISPEYKMMVFSIISKLAPFIAYLVLGVLFYLAYRKKNTLLFIFSICLFIVVSSIEYQFGLHTLLRKSAHFFAYAILAVLIYFAYKGKRAVLFSLIVVLLFATTDEIHQLFIPGRSGEARDVLIDVSGAAFGLIILKLITKNRSRRDLDVQD